MAEINIAQIFIGIGITGIGYGVVDVIRRLYRMEKKADEQAERESDCRLDLTKNYAKWVDLTGPDGRITKIEADRRKKWDDQDRLNFSREHDITKIKAKINVE